MLFRARTELELHDRRLELIIPPHASAVRRIADVTVLSAILPIHDSRDAALASLRTGGHAIVVKDLRARFGDVESYVAECSCGWTGQTHTGWRTSAREARRDGAMHVDEASSPDRIATSRGGPSWTASEARRFGRASLVSDCSPGAYLARRSPIQPAFSAASFASSSASFALPLA